MNDATTSLATRSQRRRRRGWILFGVVLALTALAAGAGWWFSSGPGGHVTIPQSVVGADPAAATATLEGLGFDVASERGEVYSVDVPVGMVATTDPGVGESVIRGTVITLNLSLGPKGVVVPALAGMPLDEATQTLSGLNMIVGEDPVEQFDAAVAEGAVISAATADGADLTAGGDSFEGVTVNLIVSAGALPPIQGMTFDDARTALTAAELDVESAPRESYHDTIPAGQVIGLVETGAIHPGDSVTIDVSQGPPPVTIPEVVGKTWAEARDLLTAAGLQIEFWNNRSRIAGEGAPNESTVDEISPGAGQVVPKGTAVKVRVSLRG